MAQKGIGPNFGNEVTAALTALSPPTTPAALGLAWASDGSINFGTASTAQKAAIKAAYTAHDPATVDPRAAYAAAIATGCQIVSTGTAALTGTYGIAPQDEINITSLRAGIVATAPWLGWYRDGSGVKHAMTADQFTALAVAILGYVEAADEALATGLSGGGWTAPAQPVNIA